MAHEERLLWIAFLTGAITDAGALLPMLFPRIADLVWGLRDESGSYQAYERSRTQHVGEAGADT